MKDNPTEKLGKGNTELKKYRYRKKHTMLII